MTERTDERLPAIEVEDPAEKLGPGSFPRGILEPEDRTRLDRLFRNGYYGHMLIASISEAKNKLSALIDRVKAGESVLIVDRGKPVARLEPAIGPEEDSEGRLARLERAGIIRRGTGKLPDDFFTRKLPRAKGGVSIVEVLLEERRQGR